MLSLPVPFSDLRGSTDIFLSAEGCGYIAEGFCFSIAVSTVPSPSSRNTRIFLRFSAVVEPLLDLRNWESGITRAVVRGWFYRFKHPRRRNNDEKNLFVVKM